MQSFARGIAVGFVLTVASAGASGPAGDDAPAKVSDADRVRVAAEAAGQAAEADRLFKAGDYTSALPLYEAERASRAALGDRRYEAYALRAIGCCRYGLGDDDAAITVWHDARKLDARRDDSGFEGYDWLLIGQAHLRRNRPLESVEAVTQALPRLSKAVDNDHEADARLVIAHALMRLDRAAEASPHLDRADALARVLNDRRRLAATWFAAARAALACDAPGLAAERADDARRAFEALDAKAESALASRALGEALADLGRLDAAVTPLEAAARDHQAVGDPGALADDLALLAAVRADAGDPAAAVPIARRAATARRDAGDPGGEVDALVAAASYLDQAGDETGSAVTLADALAVARPEATPARLVRLLILAASVTRRAGQPAGADALLVEAEKVAQAADNAALKRIVTDARAAARAPGR